MDENKKLNFGILLPIISVTILGSIYYHEVGYFERLGIPKQYIQLEINSAFSFIPIGVLVPIVIFLPAIFFERLLKERHKNGILLIGMVVTNLLNFTLCLLAAKKFDSVDLVGISTISLFCVSMIFLLRLNPGTKKSSIELPGEKNDESNALPSKLVKKYFPESIFTFLQVFCFTCIVTYFMGYYLPNLEYSSKFPYKKGKNCILLKKYSTYSILGETDSSGFLKKGEIIIQYSIKDFDTVIIKGALKIKDKN